MILLEANHDVDMLKAGSYPYPLKMRILSSHGHLCNEDAGLVLQKLHDHSGLPVYLPWGNAAEKARAETIAARLPFARVCAKLSLLQAAWLLDKADGIVGVDTGLLHLANALDKPVVGIYTDTDPLKTGVQESAWAKNLGNAGCIPSVDEVYQALQNSIAAKALATAFD